MARLCPAGVWGAWGQTPTPQLQPACPYMPPLYCLHLQLPRLVPPPTLFFVQACLVLRQLQLLHPELPVMHGSCSHPSLLLPFPLVCPHLPSLPALHHVLAQMTPQQQQGPQG